MKKIYLLLIIVFYINFYSAQNTPNIETKVPTSVPPSPTVAALMKFEEVPVSNYTGIPDVSIPIFNGQTTSKDIAIDISLKYHPSNVAADVVASDVGLGWSLFAGGTISRTVKGLPDEIKILPDNFGANSKIGIYQDNDRFNQNNYTDFKKNIVNSTLDYYNPNLSSTETDKGDEFIWEVANTGKYDAEYDLWQFNFMGKTGRFYIKKNDQTSLLEVVPLDDFRVKIINQYDPSTFVPTGFTVYDEKGYKYVFDIFETTENYSAVSSVYSPHSSDPFPQNITADKAYISAFQLTKVFDNNNNQIISLDYNTDLINENRSTVAQTFNDYGAETRDHIDERMVNYNAFGEFSPYQRKVISFVLSNVKKLQKINITNKAKVYFEFTKGRNDTNLNLGSEASSLTNIIIKDWHDKFITKYNFLYDYSTVLFERMILKSINQLDVNNLAIDNYAFSYDKNDPNTQNIGKDFWGYSNLTDPSYLTTSVDDVHKVSPEFSTTDLLTKIKLPTGGSEIFKFESNDYSFAGNTPETNFDDNPKNTIPFSLNNVLYFNNSNMTLLRPFSKDRKAVFSPSLTYPADPGTIEVLFALYKIVSGQPDQLVDNLVCPYGFSNCKIPITLEKNTGYGIRRESFDINYQATDNIKIDYYTSKDNPYQYLYGGGNRIAKIGYFDTDVSQDYYKNNLLDPIPKKEINYNYSLFSNSNKSSGSLVFLKPIFEFDDKFKIATTHITSIDPKTGETPFGPEVVEVFSYKNKTDYNVLNAADTQGSPVGYQNVSVFETNKGITKYTYTSPIDIPVENIMTSPPFLSGPNYDYKRGLLKNEQVIDNAGKMLKETNFFYLVDNYVDNTGFKFQIQKGACFTGSYFKNYNQYLSALGAPGTFFGNTNGTSYIEIANLCGKPLDVNAIHIMPYAIYQTYGWAKLDSISSKEYLYTNGISKTIKRDETFTYNPTNKNVSTHKITFGDGNTSESDYYYTAGDSPYSQNRISEISQINSYKNSKLIDSKKINYRNDLPTNLSFLPSSVLTYDIQNNTPTTEVTYNQYDNLGNLQQYTTKSGISVAIIWGYNQTQPIAKIEGATYAQVSSLAAAIIAASNSDIDGPSENTFIGTLDTFRKDPSMVGYQISTYTYDPLIGVTSITPPSGQRQIFKYDSANRLQSVVDVNGNILKENKYNYKP